MNIFHKIMLVLLFFLSIATLVFGYFLFDQREIFKTRLLALQQHTDNMARELKWGDFQTHRDKTLPERFGGWSTENRKTRQDMNNYIQDYQRLEIGLREMEKVAQDRVATMVLNKQEWDTMEGRLTETNQVLAETRTDLANTKTRLADETEAHNNTKDDLQEKIAKIQSLEGTITSLKGEITALDTQLSEKNQEIGKLKVELEGCYADALDLKEQLEACRDPTRGVIQLEDIVGNVIAIESEWNFVVVNVGKEQNLKEKTIAMIHRDDRLIGKVTITKVGDGVSIGQIMTEWTPENEMIKEGDGIMF